MYRMSICILNCHPAEGSLSSISLVFTLIGKDKILDLWVVAEKKKIDLRIRGKLVTTKTHSHVTNNNT